MIGVNFHALGRDYGFQLTFAIVNIYAVFALAHQAIGLGS